jgi:hypothetical protein
MEIWNRCNHRSYSRRDYSNRSISSSSDTLQDMKSIRSSSRHFSWFLVSLFTTLSSCSTEFEKIFDTLQQRSLFDQIVGESISQTFTRSINTSLTTLLALIVLYFVGGESTQHFSLALIIGIIAGTYSSVFIGSPLLVTIWKWQAKKGRSKWVYT